jgi:uncharacterized protein YkwD
MCEAERRVIIPGMSRWTEMVLGGRLLPRVWVVAAVLLALIAGSGTFDQSADASAYDPDELKFLQLINDYRQQNGLKPLLLSDTLEVSAVHHSRDMARYSFFAHITKASSYYPVGDQPWDRMAQEGYDYNTYKGENIAVGYETAEQVFTAWRNSPEHNHAMLDGRYREIGIARVYDPDSEHQWYWTTDFGAVRDPTTQSKDGQAEDGPDVENGDMDGKAVWKQEAKNGAELIADGHACLGDYDNGRDELSQKIQVGQNARLHYDVRIETSELRHPSDHLLVRLTNKEGEQLAVLHSYSDADAGGWRHEIADLSDFAGKTVYLSFLVRTDPMLRTAFYLDKVSLETRDSQND